MVTIPAELSRRFSITSGCRLDWEPIEGSADGFSTQGNVIRLMGRILEPSLGIWIFDPCWDSCRSLTPN